jgi:nucleotide-binding universal stress UspA family protein
MIFDKILNRTNGRTNGQENIVLLATDGSKPALTATMKAVDLAKATGATLHVVCVTEDVMSMPLERKGEEMAEEEWVGIHAKGGEVALEWAALNSVPAVLKTYPGGPVVGAILDYAKHIKPTFIVLGSSGRSGWERISLGSVAEGVMKHSPYPVVMTKGYNDEFIADILRIALAKLVPEEPPEAPLDMVPIEELHIRRKLGIAVGTLMAFLIPSFGLGFLNFPIGWITAIVFHRMASKAEAGQ